MSHAFLLSSLLDRLRAAEFAVAPDDVIRAVAIISRAEDLPASDLETLLGPLFATSQKEQEHFGRIFRDLIEPPPTPEPRAEPVVPRRNVFRAAFVTTLALFVFAFVVVRLKPVEPILDPPVVRTVPLPDETTREIPMLEAVQEITPGTIALAALLALIAAFVAWVLLSEWRRRRAPSKAPEVGPPYRWDLAPGAPPVIFPAEELARLSRALRGKTEAESVRIDVARTIARAARQPADPELVYAADLRTPEYIVLIEKRSEDDHQAAYFDRLTTLLGADGVVVRRYFFEYDPRVCWTESRARTVELADIRRRAPSARLLLFGRPGALFHAVTGAVNRKLAAELRWPAQAMITADDPSSDAVPGLVAVGGAEWMTAVGDVMSGGYRPKPASRSKPSGSSTIERARDAKARLSSAAYRWLCACAAHPRLQWELTIALGAKVCAAKLAPAFRELVALPWFRTGEIPEAERVLLVDELQRDPELARIARGVILAMLEKTDVPEGSFAARDRELQLLSQQIWLDRHDTPKLKLLFSRLQELRLPEIGRDVALVKLLLTGPGTRFAKIVPAVLRKLWFRFGIPAMGRRPIRGGAEVFLVGALMLAIFPYSEFRQPGDELRERMVSITVPAVATVATDTGTNLPPDTSGTTSTLATDTRATPSTITETVDTSGTTTTSGTDTSATTETSSTSGPVATTTTATTTAADTPCELREDRRDCGKCLVTNPFGGGCLQFGNDPVCEAAKAAANQQYKMEYTRCVQDRTQNQLLEPADGAVIRANGKTAVVTFRWTKDGVYRVIVTDAYGRDAEGLSYSQEAGTFFRAELPPGTYTWHLEPAIQLDDVGLFRSSANDPKFTVTQASNEFEAVVLLKCGVRGSQEVEVPVPRTDNISPEVSVRLSRGTGIAKVIRLEQRGNGTVVQMEIEAYIPCEPNMPPPTATLTLQISPWP